MCACCTYRVRVMSESPAAVKAKWHCEDCGDQEFEKEADPEDAQRARVLATRTDWVLVAFWLGLAAVIVAAVVAGAKP